MFSFDCNTKRYYKSQRQRHSLKWTWIECNLLNIFRSISIFILVSYRIDKNCGNDILKEQVRYYRNGVLFFKCLVLNKDLLSIRVLYKIFKSGTKAKFSISSFWILWFIVSYGNVAQKFWDKMFVCLETNFFKPKSFLNNELYLK